MNIHFIYTVTIISGLLIYGCGSDPKPGTSDVSKSLAGEKANSSTPDDSKGNGKFTDVKLTHPLDPGLLNKAQPIFDVKCAGCHKLTGEKLVGPGWKGVTDRRNPEWIMNFVTNTDVMIDKDPAAQAMLEKCMVRMPNQHLTDDDARSVLEFMRKNDGKN